ncbi:MAG: TVP38/TMEM64 family protein [Clostridia bacterium]|nr:TVP38/TMEM64 family protein [Clostridia bacterium]
MGKRKEKAKEKAKKLFKDTELKETKHYSKKVSAIVLSSFSVLSCVLAVFGFIWLQTNFSDTDALKALVEKNYLLSAVVLIFICAIQVMVALIPGELVEIASGYAFGAIPGALLCLAGITLGSVCALLLTRKLGRKFVESIYPREKIDSLPILNDPKKRNVFVALLFLIPGTPKDLITYIIGITEMSIPSYLLIATAARLPSIIISTMGGDALGNDRFLYALIAFIVSAVVSLIGYLIYIKISQKHKKPLKKDTESSD